MIGTRKILPTLLPAKITPAITEPCISDFFEPQKITVILSSRLNFISRVKARVRLRTTKNKAITLAVSIIKLNQLIPWKIPPRNESLKLRYTTERMTDLSNRLRYRLFRVAQLLQKRCKNNPAITGSKIVMNRSAITPPKSNASACFFQKEAHQERGNYNANYSGNAGIKDGTRNVSFGN